MKTTQTILKHDKKTITLNVHQVQTVEEFKKRNPKADPVAILNKEIMGKTRAAVKRALDNNKVKPTDQKGIQKIADEFKVSSADSTPKALREYDRLLKQGSITKEQHEMLVQAYHQRMEEAEEAAAASEA
jgi:hypothetical protein